MVPAIKHLLIVLNLAPDWCQFISKVTEEDWKPEKWLRHKILIVKVV